MTQPENTRVVLLTALCLFVLLPVAPASAQQSNQTDTKSIDLGSATFKGCELDGDTMLAEFDAERSTSVTLYDAGVFSTEGSFEVPSKDVNLASGSSTVKMPVTVEERSAALFIQTDSGSTGCVVNAGRVHLFNYAANWNDVRLTFLALILAAPFTFGTVAVRYKQRFDERKRLL
jgi:hypothetical protein